MGIFGSKRAPPPPPAAQPALTPAEASFLELKRQRDRVYKFETRLNFELGVYQQKALEAVRAGRQENAARFVKLRLLKQKQREQILAQLHNLETLVSSVETAQQSAAVMAAMEAGATALKAAQEACPLERVQAIMDGVEDGLEYVGQLDAELSRELAPVPGLQEKLDSALTDLFAQAEASNSGAQAAPAAPAAAAARKRAGSEAPVAAAEGSTAAIAPMPQPPSIVHTRDADAAAVAEGGAAVPVARAERQAVPA